MGLLLAFLVAFLLVPLPPASTVPTTTKSRMSYIVQAHPDDEFMGWSLVSQRSEIYPVFVLLTQGGATGFGDGHDHQPEYGETHPGGRFPSAKNSVELKAQRTGSWHRFLDQMAPADGYLGLPSSVSYGSKPDGSYPFKVTAGDSSARIEFDAQDGALTAKLVADMMQVARREAVPGRLPALPEWDIIVASYSNASGNAAQTYANADHQALHAAVFATDFGLPGRQYGRTSSADPRRDLVVALPTDIYENAMGIDYATCQRTGSLQRTYGWLAFGNGGDNPCPGSWDKAEYDTGAFFSRVQHWWTRF